MGVLGHELDIWRDILLCPVNSHVKSIISTYLRDAILSTTRDIDSVLNQVWFRLESFGHFGFVWFESGVSNARGHVCEQSALTTTPPCVCVRRRAECGSFCGHPLTHPQLQNVDERVEWSGTSIRVEQLQQKADGYRDSVKELCVSLNERMAVIQDDIITYAGERERKTMDMETLSTPSPVHVVSVMTNLL